MQGSQAGVFRFALAAGVSILALTNQAKAQNPVSGAPTPHAADTAKELDAVVVTAQHRKEDIQTVPISIQAFSGKAISELGVKSSTDLAEFTPNLEIALPNGVGNQPIISIRGIGLNDYDTNNAGPNGVYVDEVYLSAPASQTFQTFDLDRVEVLKGPQGTLYGRNTSGGAINFVSTKPSDAFEADFHADYSSFNTLAVEGAVGGALTSTIDGRAAFMVNTSDGYMHNDRTGGRENGVNNYAVRAMLLAKPSSALKILLNVHGGQVDNRPTEYRHIGDLDPATGAQCSVARTNAGQCVDLFGYGTPGSFYGGSFNRREHLKVTSIGAYLRMDYAPGPVAFTSITSVEYNNKLHPEETDASPNRLIEINYGVRSTTTTQEFRAAEALGAFSWAAGLYYLHESLSQNQPLQALLDLDTFYGAGVGDDIAFQAFDKSQQTTDAYAVFGQGEYQISPKLKFIAGGRFTGERKSFDYDGSIEYQEGGEDHFGPVTPLATSRQSLSDSAFSWRLGLDYNVTPDVLAYASVATGFKSGDFNGSFLSTSPAEIARQLLPVKPETVTAYEVGVKSTFFGRRLTIDAAAFYNDYADMQVFVLVPPVAGGSGLPVDVLDNAPKAHTDGIDLQLAARPAPDLTFSVQLGVLETRLDSYVSQRDPAQPDYSGNHLPLSPHVSAALAVGYKHAVGEGALNLQANANLKGRAFFDISNSPYLDQGAYWIGNLRAAYAFDHERWEVAGFIHNVADRHYFVDKFDLTNPFGFIQGVVGQPRTFGVEINYRY